MKYKYRPFPSAKAQLIVMRPWGKKTMTTVHVDEIDPTNHESVAQFIQEARDKSDKVVGITRNSAD